MQIFILLGIFCECLVPLCLASQFKMEKATFGAGCFWGVEAVFRALNGVTETAVGYAGGTTINPTYDDVCAGHTGHVEVVKVTFEPAIISYEELLNVFWKTHDPTTRNRQSFDFGSQYRSAIFFHSPEQEAIAIASKAAQEPRGLSKREVVTEISEAGPFYRAEEYHQRYLEKHGRAICKI